MIMITQERAINWLQDDERRSTLVGRTVTLNGNIHHPFNMDSLLADKIGDCSVSIDEVETVENMELGAVVNFFLFTVKRIS